MAASRPRSAQAGYQLELNGVPQERVETSESVLRPWPGEPLGSRARVVWRVKVWTDAGVSGWSAPAWFETGLLEARDWAARWIEPVEPTRAPPGERPAYVLQTTFVIDDPHDARMYATAHGIYETFVNGRRVGDRELTPGFTAYWANLHVQVYDVEDVLLAVRTSGGWC